MHPYIDDHEAEERLVQDEDFDDALRQSVLQKLLTGELPLIASTMIKKYLSEGKDIFDAVAMADDEMRKRQASEAPPAPEGMVAPPEAMPGMAGPPEQMMAMQQAQAQAPPPQAGPPQDPRANVQQLLAAMQGGQGA
jgi:hypothetical protein